MKNRLSDLNNHLFMQLERLGDEGLGAEEIEKEVKRTEAIVDVAEKIIGNAALTLSACKLVAEHGDHFKKDLPMIAASGSGPHEDTDYGEAKQK